jgi:hypothetical protein
MKNPLRGSISLTLLIALLLALPAAQAAPPAGEKVFPYPIHKKTLPNGLDIIVIETPEFKDVLSYNTLVLAGARNEIEPGKTGLAHLFEHILFRHRYAGELNGYDTRMMKLGTHNNAWTWFDVTFYHPLTFTANLTGTDKLPGVLELESARFTALDFTEKIFKLEAGAVLGEYRRNASFPSLRMSERLFALLFPHHPYGHETIGYYEDVLDMPNEFQAAFRDAGALLRRLAAQGCAAHPGDGRAAQERAARARPLGRRRGAAGVGSLPPAGFRSCQHRRRGGATLERVAGHPRRPALQEAALRQADSQRARV